MTDLVRAASRDNPKIDARLSEQISVRRCHLVAHLHQCGPRPVLEALLAVARGDDLDLVLEGFHRIPVAVYRALGADVLPIDRPALIDGGRRK